MVVWRNTCWLLAEVAHRTGMWGDSLRDQCSTDSCVSYGCVWLVTANSLTCCSPCYYPPLPCWLAPAYFASLSCISLPNGARPLLCMYPLCRVLSDNMLARMCTWYICASLLCARNWCSLTGLPDPLHVGRQLFLVLAAIVGLTRANISKSFQGPQSDSCHSFLSPNTTPSQRNSLLAPRKQIINQHSICWMQMDQGRRI
jgi:hypothetical protein